MTVTQPLLAVHVAQPLLAVQCTGCEPAEPGGWSKTGSCSWKNRRYTMWGSGGGTTRGREKWWHGHSRLGTWHSHSWLCNAPAGAGATRRLVKNRLIFLEKPPIIRCGEVSGAQRGGGRNGWHGHSRLGTWHNHSWLCNAPAACQRNQAVGQKQAHVLGRTADKRCGEVSGAQRGGGRNGGPGTAGCAMHRLRAGQPGGWSKTGSSSWKNRR